MNPQKLITTKQAVERWPWITSYGQLNSIIHRRADNGFGDCLVRVGRRWLIDEERVGRWLDRQRSETATPRSESGALPWEEGGRMWR